MNTEKSRNNIGKISTRFNVVTILTMVTIVVYGILWFMLPTHRDPLLFTYVVLSLIIVVGLHILSSSLSNIRNEALDYVIRSDKPMKYRPVLTPVNIILESSKRLTYRLYICRVLASVLLSAIGVVSVLFQYGITH